MNKSTTDPFLQPSTGRFVVFPVEYPELWDMYKKATALFWTVEELDFAQDVKDWNELSSNERQYLTHVLAFFAASDGIVNENLAVNMYSKVQVPEARQFYANQIFMEAIHSECYSLMIDTYIKDPIERSSAFNALNEYDSIKAKAEWALNWIGSKATFSQQLVAFCAVEGIMFCSSFAAINWMRNRGKLPGLSVANQFISRDESLHAEFATLLHAHLQEQNRCTHEDISKILVDASIVEKAFVNEALPFDMKGMNVRLMCQYVEYVTDFWLRKFGVDAHYGVKNPFPWMNLNDLDGKTNFFEGRVSDYNRSDVGGPKAFSFSDDF